MKKGAGKVRAAFMAVAAASMTVTPVATYANDNNKTAINELVIATAKDGKKKTLSGLSLTERSCVKLSDFIKSPKRYKKAPSYKLLNKMYTSSDFTHEMMVRASVTGVKVCDMKLPSNVGGVQLPGANKIGIDFRRNDPFTGEFTYLAHELAHDIQQARGGDYFQVNRNIYENQKMILSMEAAAYTAEMIAMFEATRNRTIRDRTPYKRGSDRYRPYRNFKKWYSEAQKSGLDHQAAINQAAQKTWLSVLENQDRLDLYNEKAIAFTLASMNDLKPAKAAYYTDKKLSERIRNVGRLTAKVDFTDAAKLPTTDKLFGRNDKMRDVFAAVDWYRESIIWPGSDYVVSKQQSLYKTGNRYVMADFAKATADIKNGDKALSSIARTTYTHTPKTHVNFNFKYGSTFQIRP